MKSTKNIGLSRREFLKQSALTACALGMGSVVDAATTNKAPGSKSKMILIGIDGMDPRLSERLMDKGLMPNLAKLRQKGGYQSLGTSIPPQSPVAWANFITGAGPGSHGIFDFIHRDPERQAEPFLSIATTDKG
ncbi:MAG: twin-arginine translocation signal domain-containing protein, partial [Planctomycetes bacterium]|nr:twin-arginine translocation signal domain-containing protein [Planctomycetota bacterium]